MLERTKRQELTKRQLEILGLLRKGLTNGEICRALDISENTVKVHLANIYKILDVTNRTEAVSAGMELLIDQDENAQEIPVAIAYNEEIKSYPLIHDLFLSIVESFQRSKLFQIKICEFHELGNNNAYQIRATNAKDDKDGIFISLHNGNNESILWSILQKINSSDNIKITAEQIAIQILRQMVVSAAELYEKNPNSTPKWWFASCYTINCMENRRKDMFETCESIQLSMLENRFHRDFVVCALTSSYYVAIIESWISNQVCAEKLGKAACDTMRDNPSSPYSQYAMALYNMFLGNQNEAIGYFESILEFDVPINIICRRLLSGIYNRINRKDDAMKQVLEYEARMPSSMQLPFQFVANAFINFMQGKYDECEKIAEQVLMFHPETPFARLLMIACSRKKDDSEGHQKQVNALFYYIPNFSKNDLDRFITLFDDSQKEILMDSLKDIFN